MGLFFQCLPHKRRQKFDFIFKDISHFPWKKFWKTVFKFFFVLFLKYLTLMKCPSDWNKLSIWWVWRIWKISNDNCFLILIECYSPGFLLKLRGTQFQNPRFSAYLTFSQYWGSCTQRDISWIVNFLYCNQLHFRVLGLLTWHYGLFRTPNSLVSELDYFEFSFMGRLNFTKR